MNLLKKNLKQLKIMQKPEQLHHQKILKKLLKLLSQNSPNSLQ